MNTGDTLKIAVPGMSLDSHLWVVLSDPIANPEKIVLVNFTKYREDKDQACILEPDEHPYIRVKTCVEYKRCKIVSEVQLEALVNDPNVEIREPVSPEIFDKILAGVLRSKMMALDVAQLLEDQGMIQL